MLALRTDVTSQAAALCCKWLIFNDFLVPFFWALG